LRLFANDGFVRLATSNPFALTAALPVVSLAATDNTATETGPTSGFYTVSRVGATTSALTVYYAVSGSATPGVDYQMLSGSVTIPSGQASATITVTPIDDSAIEGDVTVVVTLSPFAALRGTARRAILDAARRYGAFLGKTVTLA
jgi:hypothetical protein